MPLFYLNLYDDFVAEDEEGADTLLMEDEMGGGMDMGADTGMMGPDTGMMHDTSMMGADTAAM